MRASLLLLAAPLVFATPALAQNSPALPGQAIGSSARQFLDFASEVNVAEIRSGLVAEQKAHAPAVKAFARLMMLDHSELESQLDSIAAADGVSLPDHPSAAAEQQMNRLKSMNGSEFDTAYMKDMVDGHAKVVSKFKSEQASVRNPGVRAVVSSALPILEEHLALAESVRASLTSRQKTAAVR